MKDTMEVDKQVHEQLKCTLPRHYTERGRSQSCAV